MQNVHTILAIESSCDDTSCALLRNDRVLSNVVSSQVVHAKYGGVVPEFASRDHERRIVPVVIEALEEARCSIRDVTAVAVTRGPGLMGSLLVGLSFAKSLSLARNLPLIEVNHMQAHVLAHFIKSKDFDRVPAFPFLCLTVSGGHTQLLLVKSHLDIQVIGQTLDDAVGEAFDKAAKLLGLAYPGGPEIDKLARRGDPLRFSFSESQVPGYDYSFSGVKTSFLYFIRRELETNSSFIGMNLADICASYQRHLVRMLLSNARRAMKDLGLKVIALAGGVSANSLLREEMQFLCEQEGWDCFIPPFQYCTDNAAMIGIAGYYKAMAGEFTDLRLTPAARLPL